MKQIFLLLTLTLICLTSNAQKFESNYLGKDFLLYKGTLLKIKEDAISGFSHTFYSDLKNCQSSFDNNVIYPEKKYYFNTTKDSLSNRLFIVENIIDKNGGNLDNSSSEKPIFILKDSISKQIIYYKYDKEYEHNFPFNTSKINYPADYFCSKIEKETDEFTGETKISSPIMNANGISSTIIYKYINKVKSTYYLSLKTNGSTLNVSETGVIILFDDGTKWSRASKIEVDAESNGYEYSSFITLTPADLITFSTKNIKKFRLYIYDENVEKSDAEKFRQFVKCIKIAKK